MDTATALPLWNPQKKDNMNVCQYKEQLYLHQNDFMFSRKKLTINNMLKCGHSFWNTKQTPPKNLTCPPKAIPEKGGSKHPTIPTTVDGLEIRQENHLGCIVHPLNNGITTNLNLNWCHQQYQF